LDSARSLICAAMLDTTPAENRRFLNRLELVGCRHSVFSDCNFLCNPLGAVAGRKLRWDPYVTAKRE
jgi:hypothetical protein